MSDRPIISVVVPAYNVGSYIGRTLESVHCQTSLPDEIIVVDDGSTDSTRDEATAAAAKFPAGRVRIIHTPHLGPGAARNRAIGEANGEWIAFLDADDLWAPQKVERVREVIAANPGATMIAHDEYESDLNGTTIHKSLHERFDPRVPLLPQLYRGNFLSTSCVVVKRQLLKDVGGMDENLPAAQDYDLWLKLARSGKLVFLPEPLETYVLREGSISTRVVTRYRCLSLIGRRHAPFVAAVVGRSNAYRLRVRFVIASLYGVMKSAFALHRHADVIRIALQAPIDVLIAVFTFPRRAISPAA